MCARGSREDFRNLQRLVVWDQFHSSLQSKIKKVFCGNNNQKSLHASENRDGRRRWKGLRVLHTVSHSTRNDVGSASGYLSYVSQWIYVQPTNLNHFLKLRQTENGIR